MKIYEYEEMRNVHEAISEVKSSEDEKVIKEKECMLMNALRRVIELGNVARREGLLALEEKVQNMASASEEGYLKQLITLVVDGTDASDVHKMGWSRYYASLVKDYTALVYLIYLEGALVIQAGDNPRVLEEKLKMMLPNSLYQEYCQEQEKELEEMMRESSENIIERLCSGKRLWNPKDNGYFVMKLADYVFCDMKDGEMEKLLCEMSNEKLAVAMKGLGGEARRHIFSNMSERLGKVIAEDMVYRGPVYSATVVDALQEMLVTLLQLMDHGVIADRYAYLAPFYEMVSVDTETEQKKYSKVYELKKLVNEYEEMEKNMVE